MPASSNLKKQIKRASREAIKAAVIRLRSHIRARRWIGANNSYAKVYVRNPSEVIGRTRDLQQKQIADYIAASIFTHCADGWSLLGRALNLLAKGDSNSSVHLAYYAELRAAMSLLASEGIGVFNSKHVILTDSSSRAITTTNAPRTHKFVWNVLEHWAERKLSAEVIAEIVKPGSIPLLEWLNAFGVMGSLHPIGTAWLKSWGVDIKQFGDDQFLRNHSSYRPSRIVPKTIISADESLSFLKELWKMCEPDPGSRFNEIDKHLLRESLAEIYKSSVPPFADPRSSAANTANYKKWVESKIVNLGFAAAVQANWVDFLIWKIQPQKSKLLEEASKVTSMDDPSHHLQVLARATLLLRIATGVSGKSLQEAAFTKTDLDFWWQPYAVDHGLIDSGSALVDFLDLWADVEVALQDIDTWSVSNPAPYSYRQLSTDVSKPILVLTESERISLWGLGI